MSPRTKEPEHPAVHEKRLRNGMRVLVIERHMDPVVAVTCWYRVGALNELEDEAGVSHFLEHMMFKGTPLNGKGTIDRVTTSLGGQNNAFTSYDHTGYWFEFASDRWETALALEADRMKNLLIDPREFEAEKAVVLEELAMGQDSPWRDLGERVGELLFGRHPYRRPIIGYADVLQRLTPERMRAYYERFYHPANATIVVCGDVSQRRAFQAVKAAFGELPAGPQHVAVDPWRPPLPEPSGERRVVTRWDDPAARLLIAYPGAKLASDDDFGLDVISTILSGGRLSRLHRKLVLEDRLASFVSVQNDARVEGGGLWVYAEANTGVAPAALEKVVDEELARFCATGPTREELDRARKILRAEEAASAETVTDFSENLGEYAVDADWPLYFALSERRESFSAGALKAVARRILDSERRVVGWCLPLENGGETA